MKRRVREQERDRGRAGTRGTRGRDGTGARTPKRGEGEEEAGTDD